MMKTDHLLRVIGAGLFSVALLSAPDTSEAGTLKGQVSLKGGESPEHIAVYLENVPGSYAPPAKRPELMHRNLAFFPRVLPVLKGSVVDFPNADAVFHSAFSASPSNPFELGIYGQGREKFMQFNNAGVVEISCHIHPFMKATVLVLDNPYFTVTDQRGEYAIADIPPGTYIVRTWSANGKPTTQQVSIPSSGAMQVNIAITP
jgi:plastocyanin